MGKTRRHLYRHVTLRSWHYYLESFIATGIGSKEINNFLSADRTYKSLGNYLKETLLQEKKKANNDVADEFYDNQNKLLKRLSDTKIIEDVIKKEISLQSQCGNFDIFVRFQTSCDLRFVEFGIFKMRYLGRQYITEIQTLMHQQFQNIEDGHSAKMPAFNILKRDPWTYYVRHKIDRNMITSILSQRLLEKNYPYYPLMRTIEESLYDMQFEAHQMMNYLVQLERSWYASGLTHYPQPENSGTTPGSPDGIGGEEDWCYLPKHVGSVSVFRKLYRRLVFLREFVMIQRCRLRLPRITSNIIKYLKEADEHSDEIRIIEENLGKDQPERKDASSESNNDEKSPLRIFKDLRRKSHLEPAEELSLIDRIFFIKDCGVSDKLRNYLLQYDYLVDILECGADKKYLLEKPDTKAESLLENMRNKVAGSKDTLVQCKNAIAHITEVYHERNEGSQLRGMHVPQIFFGGRAGILDIYSSAIDNLVQDYLGPGVLFSWRGVTAMISEKSYFNIDPEIGILNVPLDIKLNLFPKLPPVCHESIHLLLYRLNAFGNKKYRDVGSTKASSVEQEDHYYLEGPTKLYWNADKNEDRVQRNSYFLDKIKAMETPLQKINEWHDDLFNKAQNELDLLKASLENICSENPEQVEILRVWYLFMKKKMSDCKTDVVDYPWTSELLCDILAGMFGGAHYFISLGVMFAAKQSRASEPASDSKYPAIWLRLLIGRELAKYFKWIPEQGGDCATLPQSTLDFMEKRFRGILDGDCDRKNLIDYLLSNEEKGSSDLARIIIESDGLNYPGEGDMEITAYEKQSDLRLFGAALYQPWFYVARALLANKEEFFKDLLLLVIDNLEPGEEEKSGIDLIEKPPREKQKEIPDTGLIDSRLLFYPPPDRAVIKGNDSSERDRLYKLSAELTNRYVQNLANSIGIRGELPVFDPPKYVVAASITWPNFKPIVPTNQLIHSLCYSEFDYARRNEYFTNTARKLRQKENNIQSKSSTSSRAL